MFNQKLKKMKKILLTLALAAFAFTANAQLIVGGQIGVRHNGSHDDNFTAGSNASTSISILPKIGYQLNETMQIGAKLGVDYTYSRNYIGTASDQYTSNTSMDWVFAPYFRYNVTNWKNFTFFVEAQGDLTIHPNSSAYNNVTSTTTDGTDKFTHIGLNVVPGLNYALTDKISLDLYINLLGLYCGMTSYDGWSSHNWGFMANADAQDLMAHFNNFSIGFNYAL